MRYHKGSYHDNRPAAPDVPWVITYGKNGKHKEIVRANSRQNALDEFKAAYEGNLWWLNYYGVEAERGTEDKS